MSKPVCIQCGTEVAFGAKMDKCVKCGHDFGFLVDVTLKNPKQTPIIHSIPNTFDFSPVAS